MPKLSFDELLALGARRPPQPYEVKALGGKTVWIRDPSSADADEWRMYCKAHQETGGTFAAKLVSILLCDESGERVVPKDDAALAALADGSPRWIDEVADVCLPLMTHPTDDEIEEIQKN